MQFSYTISETQYLQATSLASKSRFRNPTIKVTAFWAFILIALFLLFAAVSRIRESSAADDTTISQPEQAPPSTSTLIRNVLPAVVIVGVWVIILRSGPRRLRKSYQQDPLMQGTFTVTLTPEAFLSENTAGASSRLSWPSFKFWKEGDGKNAGIILLGLTSGTFYILNATQLSAEDKSQLRSHLANAIPRR